MRLLLPKCWLWVMAMLSPSSWLTRVRTPNGQAQFRSEPAFPCFPVWQGLGAKGLTGPSFCTASAASAVGLVH